MPTVYSSDLHRYVTKNDLRQMRRYSGKAIYLPDGKGLQYFNKFQDVEVNGDGFFDSVKGFFKESSPLETAGSFLKDNKDGILTGLKIGNKAVGVAGGIANLARNAEEIKLLREQRKALEEMNKTKSGAAIYLPDAGTGGEGISLRTPTISNNSSNSEVADKILKHGKGFKLLSA